VTLNIGLFPAFQQKLCFIHTNPDKISLSVGLRISEKPALIFQRESMMLSHVEMYMLELPFNQSREETF
jgi:hypothetical protein